MEPSEAIEKLNELEGDSEGSHYEADEILLECVDPEIKQAWLDVKNRVGFWYS